MQPVGSLQQWEKASANSGLEVGQKVPYAYQIQDGGSDNSSKGVRNG